MCVHLHHQLNEYGTADVKLEQQILIDLRRAYLDHVKAREWHSRIPQVPHCKEDLKSQVDQPGRHHISTLSWPLVLVHHMPNRLGGIESGRRTHRGVTLERQISIELERTYLDHVNARE